MRRGWIRESKFLEFHEEGVDTVKYITMKLDQDCHLVFEFTSYYYSTLTPPNSSKFPPQALPNLHFQSAVL